MTITSPYTPASFNGSGTTGPFSFTFRILDKTNIKVEKVVGTTVTTLTEGVGAGQYSIVLVAAGLSGGQITLGTALAIGERLIVSRVTPRTQLEKLADLRRFNAEIHERAFDKATMVIQEAEQAVSFSMKFPVADTPGRNQTLPIDTARADRVLGFNALGEPIASSLSLTSLNDFNTAVTSAQTAATTATTQAGISTTKAAEAVISAAAAQAAAAGMKRKNPARAATTAALPTVTYSNGSSGVGATLTATTNGALPAQDGVTLLNGEALLVKNQAAPAQNGIYVVTQIGTAGTPFILTRQTDSDTWDEIVAAVITVMEGTLNGDIDYLCTSNTGGTIGTTTITWQAYNSKIADGAVSTAAKFVDGIITYVKMAAAAIATVPEMVSGTASKLVNAANLLTFLQDNNVNKVWHAQAQFTSNTAGGSSNNTTWETPPLNTEVTDTIGVTLSANQFVLPAGTYDISAFSSICADNGGKLRLRNITDSTTILVGMNVRSGVGDGDAQILALRGRFTVGASKTLALQHYSVGATATFGFGYPANSGELEVYRDIMIKKVA